MKQKLYILLVEDNDADAHLVQITLNRIISDYVFEVKVARMLEEALEYLGSYKPDCILLDLTLPKTSGIDTYRAVRLSQPATPVLILTGLYDKDLALQAVSEGAGGYMLKTTVRPDTLELNIHLAMQSSRLNLLRSQADKVSKMASETQAEHLSQLGQLALLAVCSICGKVRDESVLIEAGSMDDKWLPMQTYLEKHGIHLTHSYCPTCMSDQVGKVVRNEL